MRRIAAVLQAAAVGHLHGDGVEFGLCRVERQLHGIGCCCYGVVQLVGFGREQGGLFVHLSLRSLPRVGHRLCGLEGSLHFGKQRGGEIQRTCILTLDRGAGFVGEAGGVARLG